MQRLIRQRTAGGRVQMPPTPPTMAQVAAAPLSPNVLAEPYKYARVAPGMLAEPCSPAHCLGQLVLTRC